MRASDIPASLQTPWASSAGPGYVRPIPQTSPGGNGASWPLGFPPATFLPLGAGGIPPDGRDENGVLNYITAFQQAQQAGFFPVYNAMFAGYIGGYPQNAILRSADGHGLWRSTADNNSTDPDTGGANWVAHGVRTVFGRTGPAITAQAGDYTAAEVGALATSDFTGSNQSIATNGYQKLPGGLIWQWGTTPSIPEDTETDVTFPIAFPMACFQVQATGDYGGHTDSDVIGQVCNITTTGVRIMRDSGGGSGYSGVVYWFAIGH